MSDQRLRELERRFRQTGSPEDEAALFHARLRTGEGVTEERLQIAARAGSVFAAKELGDESLAGPGWLGRLATHYEDPIRPKKARRTHALRDEVLVRTALAWVRAEQEEPTDLGLACLQATEDWLVTPGPHTLRAATNAAGVATESVESALGVDPTPPEQRRTARAAIVAYYVSRRGSVASYVTIQIATGCGPVRAKVASGSWRCRALPLLCHATSPEEQLRLEQSVSRDLTAWALGYSDPVRARVEARGQLGSH